jgi:hypothetical protein
MEEQIPQTATEYLTLGPSTQTSIDIFSDGVIQSVQAGNINPLAVLVQIRAMEKAFERILKETKDNLMREADKYPGNDFEFQGNKITKAEHGTRYDFSQCGDPVYAQRLKIVQEASEQLKEQESFLKALKAPITVVDEGSGEVVTIQPPTKRSTSGLNVAIR